MSLDYKRDRNANTVLVDEETEWIEVKDFFKQFEKYHLDLLKEVLKKRYKYRYSKPFLMRILNYTLKNRVQYGIIFYHQKKDESGKNLLKYLSVRLTTEFVKGFDESYLRRMRQFYLAYPIRDTLCHELNWKHYRILMKIADKTARDFYTEEYSKSM